MPSSIPSLIVCGSQTIPPSRDTLDNLASYLTKSPNPELQAVREVVLALPELLAILKATQPQFQELSDEPIISLRDWFLHHDTDSEDGNDSCSLSYLKIHETLPNILLAPLTVIIHIAQYSQYLDGLGLDDSHDAHAHIRQSTTSQNTTDIGPKFQGLCIGSLSSAALDASPTRTVLARNATAALKLALCIGAYVDSQRLAGSGSNFCSEMVCFIARWGEDCSRKMVEGMLSRYSEAYISVELSYNSITITVPSGDMPSLQEDLRREGVRVASVPVNGRYHNKNNNLSLQSLLQLCSSDPSGPFWVPWGQDRLESCLRSILTEPARWFSDMSKTINSFTPSAQIPITTLELGLVGCIPPPLAALPHHHIIRGSLSPSTQPYTYPDTSIAIIGAACKYPGANSLDQLWKIIATGQTMYGEAPPGRFGKETVTGNFLSDADQFDYGLFGISPREATYMDPQQRIALQVAYQAVESSGYFGSSNSDGDVGCYIGVGNSDYEYNVHSNTPTAYSFTGTSRAFISGRVSHYFKWTGPSITIDTACSSSAAAIHQACSGIILGDCSVALAGGVNIMSSFPADQNIAAAGMTNSTGPCRPFDADAAGYSRSEGCGFIVLKRLADALSQGDHVLGVVVATATNQSDGSSPITVPVLRSQSDLYRRILSRASMNASDVSYIEAHGTGTQRGDPIEYQSAREVFGGSGRYQANSHKCYIGSVKANIGHTEAASGVAGVLKVLLMLKHGQIPPQASFNSLNPAIPPSESRQISIATQPDQWKRNFRAACVNNYGAAGNNTAILICQYQPKTLPSSTDTTQTLTRYPFLITAQSQASLKRYCLALAQYIETNSKSLSLAAISSIVAQQQNRNLRHRIAFCARSLPELRDLLTFHGQAAENTSVLLSPSPRKQVKPIVLVFGGQTGSNLRFSKAVYDSSYYLRQNMDKCDSLIRRMGLPSLFPDIYSQEPVEDIVKLHSCLFSVQYACAKAWLDAGLSVHRVIGHSFGQLTAMCISGVFTLEDALRLVVGRANLIRDCWGDEKGSMLSVQVDRAGAEALAWSESNLGDDSIEVACYNGPNSHVLVGSELAISNVERRASTASLATKRLKTTHGFHSKLFDTLMEQYSDLAYTVSYHVPVIPIETCSETASWKIFTPQLVTEHSRRPVYFCDAVLRVERDLGPCIWLEAGSGSGAVMLAKQSLTSKSNYICGLQLGSPKSTNPLDSVVDTTLELWNQGSSIQCWAYNPRNLVHPSNFPGLPRYQFDTSPHWLPCATTDHNKGKGLSQEIDGLISLERLSHPEPHVFMFELDQKDGTLAHILRGREVLGGTLWPLALYIKLVSQAATLLTSSIPSASRLIRFAGLEIKTPLGSKLLNGLCLRLKQVEAWSWAFSLESDCAQHATGTVIVDERTSRTPYHLSSLPDFATTTAVFSAPGGVAYKLLEKVAEYDTAYRGLESISMNEDTAIARVHLPSAAGNSRFVGNTLTLDQFLVVAEIHALSMEDSKRSEVFACSGFGEATISANFKGATERDRSQTWQVYTRQSDKRGREFFYDTFVYEAGEGEESGSLALALTGARFIRTSTSALQQVVEPANTVSKSPGAEEIAPSPDFLQFQEGSANVWSLTVSLLHELTGYALEEISPQMILADMGMDSLAIMEIEARIREVFKVDIRISPVDMGSTIETICERITAQTSPSHGLVNVVGNWTSNTTSSSSQCTPSSSFESDSDTQATELGLGAPTMEKVARIVATHVGSGEAVLSSSRLHSLGLDSLAVLELQSDLHVSFGVRVHLMQLDYSLTISDLHALVLRRGLRENIYNGAV
ncbi:hypothetical protein ASPVEDRAFT_872283 [Aspergillus versicolor CBS 583.65]|uniref:Carrier domain-containing protein n=1 Tax=Aspergillus versicolor CBS 583.65 TaxID=1036611 RepID=A0A1L9P4Q7_ASPVE|nr:uncharacterized protein ASPVEDRAFT_872283 [Aspergillus versicolor CBS 583.65]OJI96507.1 hypothetical protein ASPVEDRAFT_872283 [Aspergillus versicolor CBS 583.65]